MRRGRGEGSVAPSFVASSRGDVVVVELNACLLYIALQRAEFVSYRNAQPPLFVISALFDARVGRCVGIGVSIVDRQQRA